LCIARIWVISLILVDTENLQFLAISHKLAANKRGGGGGGGAKLVKYELIHLKNQGSS